MNNKRSRMNSAYAIFVGADTFGRAASLLRHGMRIADRAGESTTNASIDYRIGPNGHPMWTVDVVGLTTQEVAAIGAMLDWPPRRNGGTATVSARIIGKDASEYRNRFSFTTPSGGRGYVFAATRGEALRELRRTFAQEVEQDLFPRMKENTDTGGVKLITVYAEERYEDHT